MRDLIKNNFFLVLVFFTIACSSTYAGTIDQDLIEQLSTNRQYGEIDVIIEFEKRPVNSLTRQSIINSLQNNATLGQDNLKKLLKSYGINLTSIWINNTVAASIPAYLLDTIANTPNVQRVKSDKRIVLDTSTQQGIAPTQESWNITSIRANTVWNTGITGTGIVIGSMDTGIDIDHPDLASKYRGGGNSWYDPYGTYSEPHDNNGHGTQTTGLIVGGNTSGNYIGVSPGAKWIAAKIFDDTNTATISKIHLAFQWMLDPDGNPNTNDAPNIINNSWNFGASNTCDSEFKEDIFLLRQAGISVVFSSGNSGPSISSSHSPANNSGALPVGASDELSNIAFSSSRGPSACNTQNIYPKVAAPGINVRTTDLTLGGALPNSYTYSSGTSFSAPHVSGALALLESKYPNSTIITRETALYETATSTGNSNDSGYGIIDINAAINYIDPIVQPISPSGNIGVNSSPTYTWNSVKGST